MTLENSEDQINLIYIHLEKALSETKNFMEQAKELLRDFGIAKSDCR